MNNFKIKYRIGEGYYVQKRSWKSAWIWMDVGYNDGNDIFHITYHSNIKDAEDAVKHLIWEERAERTVYLYKS